MDELSQIGMVNKAAQPIGPQAANEFLNRLEQITNHLVWIRWELALLLLLVVFFVAVLVVAVRKGLNQPNVDFSKTGQQLLNQEKYTDVVRLALQHVKSYPGDANAQWLLAQAQMRLGNHSEALIHARKTQELQPDWEQTFTGPMISHLEKQLSEAKQKPDLRVVSPNPAPQPDAPPSGGAPLS
jgi:cytochrome c-type biogenesis protein CcmH/NrfG